MTFLELKQGVYDLCGFGQSPSTAVVRRVGAWINEAQRRILRDPGMSDLRQGSLPFSSVAGQTLYAIPQVFERIDSIVQQTNDRKLRFMSRAMYRSIDPAERSSGMPDYYVPEGLRAVFMQPATTGIWAASSAVGDTTQKVNLQGVRASGDINQPIQTTLTGTTRVAIGSVTDYLEVLSWNLDTVATGTVSLYDAAAAGNVLARIPIGFKAVQYEVIRLWPTPAQALPYVVDGQWLIQDLVQDTDVPMLPPSYHDILGDYARMREYERTGDKRLSIAATQYGDGKNKLRVYVQFPPDYRPVAGSIDATVRRNNLGSWYPADYVWP